MTSVQKRIIENLTRILKYQTRAGFCQKAKIDPGNFSKFMAGKKECRIETLEKIRAALNMDASVLLESRR